MDFLRGIGSVKALRLRKSMPDADNLPTIC